MGKITYFEGLEQHGFPAEHMRVGADGGIGVKHMSVPDAEVIGMLGSGGMARTHMQSFTLVRNIRKVKVFSPTPANREAFAAEMRALYGIEVETCDRPENREEYNRRWRARRLLELLQQRREHVSASPQPSAPQFNCPD